MNLFEAIFERRSIRKYKADKISESELVDILQVFEHIPRAGGIKSLDIFFVHEEENKLKLYEAGLEQGAIKNAPVVVVISADFESKTKRYGRRGKRYIFMEAGHAAQNILLAATALGLGAVVIGAFKDSTVKEILGIKTDPLYLIPIGRV